MDDELSVLYEATLTRGTVVYGYSSRKTIGLITESAVGVDFS